MSTELTTIYYCFYDKKYYRWSQIDIPNHIEENIKPSKEVKKFIKLLKYNSNIHCSFTISGILYQYKEDHEFMKLLIYSVDPYIIEYKKRYIKLKKVTTDYQRIEQLTDSINRLCTRLEIPVESILKKDIVPICDNCHEERNLVELKCCKRKICEICFKPLQPCPCCDKKLKI